MRKLKIIDNINIKMQKWFRLPTFEELQKKMYDCFKTIHMALIAIKYYLRKPCKLILHAVY